jgi:outer membrane protein assembly factor BamB
VYGDLDGDGWPDLAAWAIVPERERFDLLSVDLIEAGVRWRALEGLELEAPAALHLGGHRAYVSLPGGELLALDGATGRRAWTARLSDVVRVESGGLFSEDPPAPRLVDPGFEASFLAAYAIDGQLHILDRRTGGLLWRRLLEGPPQRLDATQDRLILTTGDHVEVIEPERGEVIAQAEVSGHVERVGDHLYAFGDPGRGRPRRALRLSDLEVVMETSAGKGSAGVVVDGRMIAFDGERLQALPEGPEVSTELRPGFRVRRLLPVGRDLVAVLEKERGTPRLELAGLGLPELEVLWTSDSLAPSTVLGHDRETIVTGSPRGSGALFMGLDAASGALLWENPLELQTGADFEVRSLALDHGLVCVEASDLPIALRPDTGRLVYPRDASEDVEDLRRVRVEAPAPVPAPVGPPPAPSSGPARRRPEDPYAGAWKMSVLGLLVLAALIGLLVWGLGGFAP